MVGLMLSGCSSITPQKMGISQDEWNSFDKIKQKELLANYKSLNQERLAEDSQKSSKEDNEDDESDLYGNAITSQNSLTVKITGGTAMLPPFTNDQSYQDIEFTIDADSCKNSFVSAENSESQVTLRSCYKNNILSLDPSAYDVKKKMGTITFNYSPLWNDGFIYHKVDTNGLVRFKNATVWIQKNT